MKNISKALTKLKNLWKILTKKITKKLFSDKRQSFIHKIKLLIATDQNNKNINQPLFVKHFYFSYFISLFYLITFAFHLHEDSHDQVVAVFLLHIQEDLDTFWSSFSKAFLAFLVISNWQFLRHETIFRIVVILEHR